VPTEQDWGDCNSGHIEDLDLKYAHDVFIGKTNEEMQRHYKDHVLMRAEDLHWMSQKPFQYYIFGFRDFVLRRDFGFFENSDAASSFLQLILLKLKEQPDHIRPVLSQLMPDIEFIANNQELYEADKDIYGDFKETLREISELSNGA
jgi:hypothetical protein